MDAKVAYNALAKHYDKLWTPCNKLVEAYQKHLPATDAKVLEFGCGTGAFLDALKLHDATGIDSSKEMLKQARQKLPEARFVQGDITDTKLYETFDAVIAPFDTMNHLVTKEAWTKTMNNAKHHLKENGMFLFDVHTAQKMQYIHRHPSNINELEITVKQTTENHYEWNLRYKNQTIQIPQYIPTKTTINELCTQTFSTTNHQHIYDQESNNPKGRILYACR